MDIMMTNIVKFKDQYYSDFKAKNEREWAAYKYRLDTESFDDIVIDDIAKNMLRWLIDD